MMEKRDNKTLELLGQMAERLTGNQAAFLALQAAAEDIRACVLEEIQMVDMVADDFEQAISEANGILQAFEKASDWMQAAEQLQGLYTLVEKCLNQNPFFLKPCEGDSNQYQMQDPFLHKQDARYLFMGAEFDKFWTKLSEGENFSLLRWGDGERAILTEEGVTAQEGWKVPEGEKGFSSALREALDLTEPRVYHGISCPCCDARAYYWYCSHMNSRQLTFANLWVNSNYHRFIQKLGELKRDAVVIGNAAGRGKAIGALNILDYYEVSDDCLDFFYHNLDALMQEIMEKYGQRKNLLFAISAGPLTEIMIQRLFQNNPDNCYIDFGSCLDTFIHQKITRPYMVYQYPECFMHNPEQVSSDVTVVLTLYRRPEILLRQLEAVEKQTLRPKEILLFQDRINGYYQIELSEEIKKRFQGVHICTENVGVWGRFQYAKEVASCPYVCLLDDDTIPGDRWLENCHIHMNQLEAVYGTIGILLNKNQLYPAGRAARVGWGAPRQRATEVDFAGHAWFVKREHLEYLFDAPLLTSQKYKYVAEDITLSVQCQKHGIPTVIPVHYIQDSAFWGSKPEIAMQLGGVSNEVAVSAGSVNCASMNFALRELEGSGWKSMIYRDKNYVENVLRDVIDMECNRAGWGEDV